MDALLLPAEGGGGDERRGAEGGPVPRRGEVSAAGVFSDGQIFPGTVAGSAKGAGSYFPGPGPLFVPFTVFLAGLVMLIYARLFGDELIPVGSRAARRDLGPGADRAALGAPTFNPAPLFNQQRANTAEIYQPPSVTENTTKLLDNDS